jgi:predicted DNA-binding transcriptional regulator YafY
MFTTDEVEAIAVGARMVRRLRDPDLAEAAERVLAKVTDVLPAALRDNLVAAPLYVSLGSAPEAAGIEFSELRRAIRERRKLRLAYLDQANGRTERTVWPLAMAYYVDITLIGAWCELRSGYRNFRTDRIAEGRVLDEQFRDDNGRLMEGWLALPKERPR